MLAAGSLAFVGPLAVGGSAAAGHLTRAGALIQQLQDQLTAGNAEGARDTLARLRAETRAAAARTTGGAWTVGRRLPVVGDDVAAVRTVAEILDDLTGDGLSPLVSAAATLRPGAFVPRRGRVDIGTVAEVAPALAAADDAVQRALRRAEAIRAAGLTSRVRAGVRQLRDGLRRAAAATGSAARTAALLPPLLGVDGPRTYLVTVQNLAEARATGGMPGAFVVITARQGAVRIVDQGSATGLRTFKRPVLPVASSMRDLYTDRLATYPADVNFTPHFPTAAALLREMYRRRSGREVDGVFATDPVALAHVLRATGAVSDPAGKSLSTGNAVRRLLSDAYLRLDDNAAQDRYFAGVAKAVFGRLTRAPGDPRALMAALGRAAGERRILLWSAHPAEQSLIGGTVLEGALPTEDTTAPRVGVFLNDGTGAKLGYHLDRAAELTAGACLPDGRRELRVRVTLRSTAPRRGLPRSVLGLSLAGPYTVRTNVLVFSPAGGAVGHASLDGRPVGLATGAERDRAVAVVTVDVPPGASRTLEATVLTAAGAGATATGAPELWLTPGPRPWRRHVDSPAPCRLDR